MLNDNGPKMDPWAIPLGTGFQLEYCPLFLLVVYDRWNSSLWSQLFFHRLCIPWVREIRSCGRKSKTVSCGNWFLFCWLSFPFSIRQCNCWTKFLYQVTTPFALALVQSPLFCSSCLWVYEKAFCDDGSRFVDTRALDDLMVMLLLLLLSLLVNLFRMKTILIMHQGSKVFSCESTWYIRIYKTRTQITGRSCKSHFARNFESVDDYGSNLPTVPSVL